MSVKSLWFIGESLYSEDQEIARRVAGQVLLLSHSFPTAKSLKRQALVARECRRRGIPCTREET